MNPSSVIQTVSVGDSPATQTARTPMVVTYQVTRTIAVQGQVPLTNSERAVRITPVLEKILALPVQLHWGINE